MHCLMALLAWCVSSGVVYVGLAAIRCGRYVLKTSVTSRHNIYADFLIFKASGTGDCYILMSFILII